ncbi:MAG TPA: S41 family peptidase [Steroidobacteraceae bacterium]|jgi:carboxyl-terminal processing protease|nr:S41 family peptidase [Steroidobacteraceae bacterium]
MSSGKRTLIALIAGAIFGFSAALAGGVLAEDPGVQSGSNDPASLPWQEARLFAEVYEHIKHDYVDQVSDRKLMDAAIRGMVSSLDPHSAYLNNEEFEETRLSTMGSYPGVGIEVAADGSSVKVVDAIQGSPADQAGLRAGDEIVAIDGRGVGSDVNSAIEHMRGVTGSKVTLTIHRAGTRGLLKFALRRANVEVHSVSYQSLAPGIGYVRIDDFSDTTPDEVNAAVSKLQRDNHGGLHGLVLDLRDNPGGVLESGAAVADDFLNSGVILTAEGRTSDARFEMDATPGDLMNGAPIVVLVNSGTASAAEIVSAALKDHGRALLIGHRTYGKGTVQTVIPLEYGGAVKLTTSRYFTPSGGSVQGKGILPDIVERGPERQPADIMSAKGAPSLQSRDAEVQLALTTLEHETHGGSSPGHLLKTVAQNTAPALAGDDMLP